MRCVVCGENNKPEVTICGRCGVALGHIGLASHQDIVLYVKQGAGAIIPVQSPSREGYILGRSDEGSDYMPDIDLAVYGAKDQGISRRHAALVKYRHVLHLVDLESVNGTYLNGVRLPAEAPSPVNIGDVMTLGHLELVVRLP